MGDTCVLFVATQRGLRCLQRVHALVPTLRLIVFSFREDDHEPPFMDAIRAATEAAGGTFYEARKVDGPKWEALWASTPVTLMLSVSWRYMIPASVYRLPTRGAYVFHDSLLPTYRGFAPSVWALVNGATESGATLFCMEDAVDSGDIVEQRRVPIGPDDTIAVLMERVTLTYLALLDAQLVPLLEGRAPRTPQDQSLATFTCKRTLGDNRIDWTRPAAQVYNLIRAVTSPYPGAWTTLNGAKLTVWSAQRLPDYRRYVGVVAGRVLEVRAGVGAVVLCTDGVALLLEWVQCEGEGERKRADQVLKSIAMTLGQ